MTETLHIHRDNPQKRLLKRVVSCLERGGVVVLPTETSYVLAALLEETKPLDKIRQIRQLDEKHQFALLCADVSVVSKYTRLENYAFRLLKKFTPGAYTFILKATKAVPRRILPANQKTIGIRLPRHQTINELLSLLDKPLVCTTLILPEQDSPMVDIWDIQDEIGHAVDLIVDDGPGATESTSIIDLTGEYPVILREGLGETHNFLTD